jgi:hypothetical protein
MNCSHDGEKLRNERRNSEQCWEQRLKCAAAAATGGLLTGSCIAPGVIVVLAGPVVEEK